MGFLLLRLSCAAASVNRYSPLKSVRERDLQSDGTILNSLENALTAETSAS